MQNRVGRRLNFVFGFAGLIPVLMLALYLGAAQPGMADPTTVMGSEKAAVEPLYFTQLLTETTPFTVYLPLVMNYYADIPCQVFLFDDFSDPTSGWPSGNTVFGSAYYDQGVYRMVANNAGGYKIFAGVSPDRIVPNDAVIKVDAWIDSAPEAYGLVPSISLVFGLGTMPFQDQLIWIDWYEFRVSPEQQYYRIWKWRSMGNQFDVLTSGTSTAILPELNAVQKLEVRRTGNEITLVVNGTVLETINDDTNPYSGERLVGIGAGDFNRAGFDNFEVTATTCMPSQ